MEFKCPNCGGALNFDTESQKLKCPHCDGTFDVDSFKEESGYTIENENFDGKEDLVTYTCNSCGGVIITDKNTVATKCPYCLNPVYLSGKVEGGYKPSRVIPFKYDKNQAKEAFYNFLKKKVLIPNNFNDEAIISEIKGIYVPYWLFNGTANAKIWYDATKTRMWSDGDYNYTETSIYKLFRSGRVSFKDVPVDASSNVPDELTESIEPFDTVEAKEFNPNYLAGYMADKYDVSVEESQKIASSRISNSTISMFNSTTIGYSTCIPTNNNVFLSDTKQEYVMYPLWLLNIKYNDEIYTFAMNGQTGKMVGKLPTDKGKFYKYMFAILAISFIIITLIQFLIIKL